MHERGMTVPIILAVIIIAGIGLYFLLAGQRSEAPTLDEGVSEEATPQNEAADGEVGGPDAGSTDGVSEDQDASVEGTATSGDEVSDAADGGADTLEVLSEESGVYAPYAPELVSEAAEGNTVLFFHADWCPSCRATEEDILANEGSIPADLSILKVNYDEAADLRQRYGVTTQHTFIEVDAAGNELDQWTAATLADIIENVQ
ncbi:hypothetical protein GVX82_02740 [Patescibacteria group bacterium]|jgi:thiol-disulfide isomerase/thioredoxin|nr:hypothetical protein [Patescibacteria group bacterium]